MDGLTDLEFFLHMIYLPLFALVALFIYFFTDVATSTRVEAFSIMAIIRARHLHC